MGAQGLWQNPPFFAEGDALGLLSNPESPGRWVPLCDLLLRHIVWWHRRLPASTFPTDFRLFPPPPNLSTFTGTLFYQPTNFKLGKVQQFNVNVERQLPGNIVLTVGYAGARGNHILVAGNNLNTAGPTRMQRRDDRLQCRTALPTCLPHRVRSNAILAFGDYGKTTYDSLQIKAETKTPRYGLYALIGYTYSHTYDNGLSDGLGSLLSAPYFPLPNWEKLDWALSQINLNNSFTASVIYDLALR